MKTCQLSGDRIWGVIHMAEFSVIKVSLCTKKMKKKFKLMLKKICWPSLIIESTVTLTVLHPVLELVLYPQMANVLLLNRIPESCDLIPAASAAFSCVERLTSFQMTGHPLPFFWHLLCKTGVTMPHSQSSSVSVLIRVRHCDERRLHTERKRGPECCTSKCKGEQYIRYVHPLKGDWARDLLIELSCVFPVREWSLKAHLCYGRLQLSVGDVLRRSE